MCDDCGKREALRDDPYQRCLECAERAAERLQGEPSYYGSNEHERAEMQDRARRLK